MTSDACFERVIRACAERTDEDGTWIDERIVRWYVALHRAGYAHSVEAWRGDELVGGVYGVSIGGAFFGESMFSRPRPRLADGSRDPIDGADASKVALVTLAGHLHACGYTLFDTQFQNDHIAQFGVVEITREAYFERLREACEGPDRWRAIEARSR